MYLKNFLIEDFIFSTISQFCFNVTISILYSSAELIATEPTVSQQLQK